MGSGGRTRGWKADAGLEGIAANALTASADTMEAGAGWRIELPLCEILTL